VFIRGSILLASIRGSILFFIRGLNSISLPHLQAELGSDRIRFPTQNRLFSQVVELFLNASGNALPRLHDTVSYEEQD